MALELAYLPGRQRGRIGVMATGDQKPVASTSQNPALSTENKAEPVPTKVAKELKPWQAWFTALCIPMFLVMFTCAMLGLYVLTGKLCSSAPCLLWAAYVYHCDTFVAPFERKRCHADNDQSTWLGQSWFGSQWRRLINWNQFISAATLNGGLLGGLYA